MSNIRRGHSLADSCLNVQNGPARGTPFADCIIMAALSKPKSYRKHDPSGKGLDNEWLRTLIAGRHSREYSPAASTAPPAVLVSNLAAGRLPLSYYRSVYRT